MVKAIDLTGQKFGRLTVIDRAENDKHNKARWNCECECGGLITTVSAHLRGGRTQSCGCLMREVASKIGKKRATHKMTNTKEYVTWCNIHRRCSNPKHKSYNEYGGRGITVCERWMSFENFYADMGPRPSDDHSIDRKDVNGNYEPANCRWITQKEQCRNKTNNHMMEYKGENRCIAEWADICGVNRKALLERIKLGWSIEKALETPVKRIKDADTTKER